MIWAETTKKWLRFPTHTMCLDQTQVGLVDQRGSLERVASCG